jgi:hypothetical protein
MRICSTTRDVVDLNATRTLDNEQRSIPLPALMNFVTALNQLDSLVPILASKGT